MERTMAKVELYNICKNGRAVGNGWMVSRFMLDGRRCNMLKDFGRDEQAARAYAELWNGPDGVR